MTPVVAPLAELYRFRELLDQWKAEDTDTFEKIDATRHYHRLQVQDFLQAILEDRDPMITGVEGRKTVELFTAIYRSRRDGKPVQFPLDAEAGADDFDGRMRDPDVML